jgi:hypothetical protein
MTRAEWSAMADPDRNPQFRRRWFDSPPDAEALADRAPGMDGLAVLVSADFRRARLVREGAGAQGLEAVGRWHQG